MVLRTTLLVEQLCDKHCAAQLRRDTLGDNNKAMSAVTHCYAAAKKPLPKTCTQCSVPSLGSWSRPLFRALF